MKKSGANDEYMRLLRFLEYTLHELPAGVLYDANGADEKKCAELMSDTYRLEALAKDIGSDLSEFLATCRWHYERYPHYLSRQRHFGSYANYMANITPLQRQGPNPPAAGKAGSGSCFEEEA